MEEEKRTYQTDTEIAPTLRLQLEGAEEQEAKQRLKPCLDRDKSFLSEDLIVGLIKKIEAL